MTSRMLQELQARIGQEMTGFLPELILSGAIVLLLLLRFVPGLERRHLGWAALLATGGMLYASILQWQYLAETASVSLFSGLLVLDTFAVYIKLFLAVFALLVVALTMMTGIPDSDDSADFYVLLLGATLGMSVMASANHLLMIFLGIEMASIPSYAMAGFLKGRRQSSEAALKYVVYGGGAAGVMLYGISLLAGKFGTGYLPDVLSFVAANPTDPVILMGMVFLLIGIGFKLAAFPFHFWCPDVFEGAAAEVGAFLSVASKGAALAILGRIALGLADAPSLMIPVLAVFATVTVTFGNLAAYAQTNLKRLLAYSTIAHAGFMMMALATLRPEGAGAVLFYLAVYLVMNLGAFAVVAFIRNQTNSEDLRDLRGLVSRAPILVACLGVFLLSLLGIPPLGGFAAKFQIFASLFESAQAYWNAGQTNYGNILFGLLLVGGLNTVLSLFYYVRVLKVMVLEKPLEEVEGRESTPLAVPAWQNAYVIVLSVVIVAMGLFWNQLSQASSSRGIGTFQPRVAQAPPAQGAGN